MTQDTKAVDADIENIREAIYHSARPNGAAASLDRLINLITQWQPIETAPKDGTPILASNENIQYVAWFKNNWNFFAHENPEIGTFYFFPTHWMDLPAAPTPPEACAKSSIFQSAPENIESDQEHNGAHEEIGFTQTELKEGDRVTFCNWMGRQDCVVTKDEDGYLILKPEERE